MFVEKGSVSDQALGRDVQERLARKGAVRRVEFVPSQLSDPIAKGRLLATMQAAPLVVSVGDQATSFAAAELERTRVYFVAAVVPGAALKSPSLFGTFSYNAEDLIGALPADWRRGLGLLFTPGYEPVAAALRAAASARGAALVEKRVARLKDLPGALEGLSRARAVLVVGDPLLVEGAGFEYLSEVLLARGVPLIATRAAEVRRGALLCSRAAPAALAGAVSEDAWRLASGEPREPRVVLAPPGGEILYHPALGRRFGLEPRRGWRQVR